MLHQDNHIMNPNQNRNHKCQGLPVPGIGPWTCKSEHILIKKIPEKVENFKFRDKLMSELLELLIIKSNRIIALTGLRGIGKSSLAKSVLHYAADRKMFTGGILFVKL